MKLLEEQLDVELLVPHRRGVEPSEPQSTAGIGKDMLWPMQILPDRALGPRD
jgi:hypothetical protein